MILDDNQGIRFVKDDNFMSRRIIQNKMINIYNKTTVTKQKLIEDFSAAYNIKI